MRISDWSSDVCSSDLIHMRDTARVLRHRQGSGLKRRGAARRSAAVIGGPAYRHRRRVRLEIDVETQRCRLRAAEQETFIVVDEVVRDAKAVARRVNR